jgi:type II secretory pathway pseudopilin PulG
MNQSTRTSRAAAVGPRSRQGGFAILEALIAFLVVAFGMLAIAAFQVTLSRSSDLAKQRTEATRIAQSHIDRARSFVSRAGDGDLSDGRLTYTEDLAVGTITPPNITGPMTNTVFRQEIVISQPTAPVPAGGEPYRWVTVAVAWDDRIGSPLPTAATRCQGAQNEVCLTTVISDGASSGLGSLATGGGIPSTLRPKNRNINVPYPAVTLVGGLTSAFMPPPGTSIFVFNNDSGNVTQFCRTTSYPVTAITSTGTTATATTGTSHPFTTGMVVNIVGATPAGYNGQVTVTGVVPGVSFNYTVASGLATPATLSGASATRVVALTENMTLATGPGIICTTYTTPSYLLSGYVRFKTQGAAANAANIDDPRDLTDVTRPLVPTVYDSATSTFTSQPVTITSTGTGNAPAGYECYAQRQLTVSWNNPPAGTPSEITIAEGAAVPSGYSSTNALRFIAYTCVVTPAAATPPIWSGEVTLNPLVWTFGTSGNLGATTGTGRLCRFSSDYNRNATLSNSEHPRFYRRVSGTLDSQNFLVVNGSDSCPTDVASDPANGNYLDTNTAQHQPGPAVLSFRCLTAACTGAGRDTNFETSPTNPAAAIPME